MVPLIVHRFFKSIRTWTYTTQITVWPIVNYRSQTCNQHWFQDARDRCFCGIHSSATQSVTRYESKSSLPLMIFETDGHTCERWKTQLVMAHITLTKCCWILLKPGWVFSTSQSDAAISSAQLKAMLQIDRKTKEENTNTQEKTTGPYFRRLKQKGYFKLNV